MSTTGTPATPAGLDQRGRRFWSSTVADFDLSGAELELLAEVCRTLDNLDQLADMIGKHGATVKGSQGQPVVNPALTEARGQRAILHRLLAALQLPDEDDQPVPSARSVASRDAARARWARQRRQGA